MFAPGVPGRMRRHASVRCSFLLFRGREAFFGGSTRRNLFFLMPEDSAEALRVSSIFCGAGMFPGCIVFAVRRSSGSFWKDPRRSIWCFRRSRRGELFWDTALKESLMFWFPPWPGRGLGFVRPFPRSMGFSALPFLRSISMRITKKAKLRKFFGTIPSGVSMS